MRNAATIEVMGSFHYAFRPPYLSGDDRIEPRTAPTAHDNGRVRSAMADLRRLVTIADVDVQGSDIVGISARLELELADGTRVTLLNDRGWSGGGWGCLSVSTVQKTARDVVGPDEPFGGRSQEDMATLHWSSLLETAQRHGIITNMTELRQLPHDVVLTPRLLARVGPAQEND